MSKLKEMFFPALAGLDVIKQAHISPIQKLELLRHWQNPHASRKALVKLKELIAELEPPVYRTFIDAIEGEIVRRKS